MVERPEIAGSDAYRRPSALEAAGAALARLLPESGLRRWLRSAYHAALGGERGLPATLPGGEVIRVLPEFRYLTWNPAEYAAFRAAAAPGGVAMDIGANVGAYALLFARWVHPGGRVYAFEPSAAARHGLERHLVLNDLDAAVTVVPAAVADREGAAVLTGTGLHGDSRLAEGGSGGEPVEMVTVDAFCAREGVLPTLIKIDVEGFELEALRGARETIARAGPALGLFVEMHPSVWRERGLAAADLLEELRVQGLRAEPLRQVADAWALEGECLRLVRS